MSANDEVLKNLTSALGRVVSNSKTDRVAALAYLQACLAQTALQALLDLLQSKNVFSREEIDRALNHAYEDRFKQLSGSNGVVAMPHPTTRSQ